MENSQLPKSLHTVRILVAIASAELRRHGGGRAPTASEYVAMIIWSAKICGYEDASQFDPLIVKAADRLARQSLRAVA